MKSNVVISASGYAYEDIEPVVEAIARNKARQYKKIAYYDPDDIKQEVRIKCFQTLRSFNPARSGANIRVFLAICADNKLKDIKRNIIYKHTSPCDRCDCCDHETGDCSLYPADKKQCSKYQRHEKYVHTKLSVNSPISIEEKRVIDNRSQVYSDRVDFIDYIFSLIPSGMLNLFGSFRDNNFNLDAMSNKDREKIMLTLKDVFYPEEWL